MKALKGLAAALMVGILLVCFAVPVGASGVDVQGSLTRSGEWLRSAVPEAGLGDEDVVLALLRGGYVSGVQEYTQSYLRAVKEHAAAGGAAQQATSESAKQALVLAAAGVDIKKEVPKLWNAVNDKNAVEAGGAEAQRAVLLLFGTSEALAQQSSLNLGEIAAALAATRHEDGGFGAGGVSDVLTTARTMQALGAWKTAGGVEEALLYAEMYLQMQTNDFGGFDVNGSPSALAVAEAVLAMDCQGFDPDMLGPESAPLMNALVIFQNEEGSFSADPDTPADAALTARCMQALDAKLRYDRQKTASYDFSDVTPVTISDAPVASGDESALVQSGANGVSNNGTGGMPVWLIVVLLVAVVGLIVVLAVVFAKRGKKDKKKKKKKYYR